MLVDNGSRVSRIFLRVFFFNEEVEEKGVEVKDINWEIWRSFVLEFEGIDWEVGILVRLIDIRGYIFIGF